MHGMAKAGQRLAQHSKGEAWHGNAKAEQSAAQQGHSLA